MYSGVKKLNNCVPVRFMGNSKPLKKGVKLNFKKWIVHAVQINFLQFGFFFIYVNCAGHMKYTAFNLSNGFMAYLHAIELFMYFCTNINLMIFFCTCELLYWYITLLLSFCSDKLLNLIINVAMF